ncbi:MAG TPA: hypothetical protein VMW72_25510 [Sedimentisphaerales bacterium]|nr:hypothetical protein [Sedimentisphaerales bacterium]
MKRVYKVLSICLNVTTASIVACLHPCTVHSLLAWLGHLRSPTFEGLI